MHRDWQLEDFLKEGNSFFLVLLRSFIQCIFLHTGLSAMAVRVGLTWDSPLAAIVAGIIHSFIIY